VVNLRLREYRNKSGMSQRDIAKLLGITQAYYWKWENKKSSPDAKQIMQLCNIFKCSPNELFGFRGVHIITAEEVH